MDMSSAIVPKSDQMNADDLMSGPMTVTITDVTPGSSEQPVNVSLAEFPRPWRPSKSMSRVLVMAWGRESSAYVGRRLTLYRDPAVTFGPDAVGGIRVSHMSDLKDGKRFSLALTTKRGSRKPYIVEPLSDDAPASAPVSEDELRIAELTKEWHEADDERKVEIQIEVEQLRGQA